MYKLLIVVLVLGYLPVSGQQFLFYKSKITIKEKNEIDSSSSIMKGTITIDNAADTIGMDMFFPEKERWKIQDSTMIVYGNNGELKKTNLKKFDKASIYRDLINIHKTDYGLKDLGFTIKEVVPDSVTTYVYWESPKNLQFIVGSAMTVVEDNKLTAVSILDKEGGEISATFFSKYKVYQNTAVPTKILSKISTKKGNIYKTIEFDVLQVN
jgi:hypothetical protein